MANQHTTENYTTKEINKILSLYENGMLFSKIGLNLGRKKNRLFDNRK